MEDLGQKIAAQKVETKTGEAQKIGLVIWINGLSGSGKSTISRALYAQLKAHHDNVVYLDGDHFREIFTERGYDKDSRIHIAHKRAKLCEMLSNQGIVVIASTISLFAEVYSFNRALFRHHLEVYVKCDLEELKRRDQKGLYSGALLGEIRDVVGIDIAFDEPHADLVIDNSSPDNLAAKVARILERLENIPLVRA